MASVRLKIWENFPLGAASASNVGPAASSLYIHGVYIEGSISFSNVNLLCPLSSSNASVHLGLYSLTGSTLSLANSASALMTAAYSFLSCATSATQDITPGNWYIGVLSPAATPGKFVIQSTPGSVTSTYGGILVKGIYSATTTALPVSANTSEFTKQGGIASAFPFPYIVISA